jgi:Xaa-Pro dipeptidase
MSANPERKLSAEHYQNARRKAQEAIDHSEYDAVVAMSPECIVYFLGIFVPTHRTNPERLYMMLFQKGESPSLIVSNVAERYIKLQNEIGDVHVYTEYQESPLEVLANLLKKKKISSGKIGIEMNYLTASHYLGLKEFSPAGTRFVNCSDFLGRIRMVKDEEEIRLLTDLALVTEKAIEQAFEETHVHDSAETLKCNAIANIGKVGADHINFCIFDRMSPAATHAPNALLEGNLLKIDLSGDFKGYMSDIARVAIVGKPGKDLLEAHERYLKLHREIIDMMRPDVKMDDIFQFYYRRFAEEKLVPRNGVHIGHSLGTGHHDYPMISSAHATREQRLVPNMVMNVEPVGVTGDGKYRLQFESTILITKDRPRLMSTYTNLDNMKIMG